MARHARSQPVLVVYHGTDETFDRFSLSHARTARHIYTDPDPHNASGYGKNLLSVSASLGRMLDLRIEHLWEECCPQTWRHLRAIWRAVRKGYGIPGFDEFVELVVGGGLYQYASSSALQDDVLEAAFRRGFHCVCITDRGTCGAFSSSFIFDDPERLKIIDVSPSRRAA